MLHQALTDPPLRYCLRHIHTHQPHATPASHAESILPLLGLEPDKPLLPAFPADRTYGGLKLLPVGLHARNANTDWCMDWQTFGKLFILSFSRQTHQISTDNSKETIFFFFLQSRNIIKEKPQLPANFLC